MIRLLTALAAASALTACVDIGLDGNDTDSGTTIPDPTNNPDAPLEVIAGSVDCLDDTTVQFEMSTTGPAASTEIYAQETANVEPQWGENTNLTPVADSPGEWEATLQTTAVTPSEVVQDSTSLFKCSRDINNNPQHHNAPVMTYVFRAYDATGVEFDCVVAGEDPDNLIAAAFTVASAGPANPDQINATDCRVEAFDY